MDVEGPVGAFTEFAVADDVDAGVGLLAHDFGDGFGETRLERRLVIGLAVLDGAPELDQFRRPDQAADMGGQDPIGVLRHRSSLP